MFTQKNNYVTAVIFFMTVVILFSCDVKQEPPQQSSIHDILNADIAFSDMSKQIGMKKAFLKYMDNDGVLLRPGHFPIVGAQAIDFLSQLSDTAYSLTWLPMKAEIAKSGDLGFTYGVYKLTIRDSIYKGTYINVWKKEKDGSWKFILNSGNDGIAN